MRMMDSKDGRFHTSGRLFCTDAGLWKSRKYQAGIFKVSVCSGLISALRRQFLFCILWKNCYPAYLAADG